MAGEGGDELRGRDLGEDVEPHDGAHRGPGEGQVGGPGPRGIGRRGLWLLEHLRDGAVAREPHDGLRVRAQRLRRPGHEGVLSGANYIG